MSGRGFFSRMIGGEGGEDETRIYSADELETSKRPPERQEFKEEHQQAHGFTAERAAETLDEQPPQAPRASARRPHRRAPGGGVCGARLRALAPGGSRERRAPQQPWAAGGRRGEGRGTREVCPRA